MIRGSCLCGAVAFEIDGRVTPIQLCHARRCQKFNPQPGAKVTWTNTSTLDGKVIQTQSAIADPWGLVTLEKVVVTKGKNRIRIAR